MKSFINGIKATMRLKRAGQNLNRPEVLLYVPAEICRDSPAADLPEELMERVGRVVAHLEELEFEQAAAIIEKAYNKGNMLTPTFYEHEFLLKPFEYFLNASGGSTLEAKDMLHKLNDWMRRAPDCPYATSAFMLCCTHAAFAYRGTGWADDVTENGSEAFEQFATLGKNIAAETINHQGHHWLWRKAHLNLALIDYESERDSWQRFQAALALQPDSSELIHTFTHHLLPRWYGDLTQLTRLCDIVLLHANRDVACSLYEDILLYLHAYEEEEFLQLCKPEIWGERARQCVAEGSDANLTRAVWMFFWACEYQNVLDTLTQTEVYNADAWAPRQSLEYCISFSIESLKGQSKNVG